MLSALIGRYLRAARIDEVMAHLARITEHDRYQASLGIERAADSIANAAEVIGLRDVTIERFVADGSTPWWTYQAPRAWTPTTARLEVRANDRTIVAVDHATQPFTIATYSAAVPAGLIARVARLGDDVTGAVVIVGSAEFVRPDLAAMLTARGAIGFVTDGPSRAGLPGRVELASDTSLFAFSVTTAQREMIEAAIGSSVEADVADGVRARVHIDIDRSASMPVVTGVLPGRTSEEVWLTSHLCHPRPGANDNASGAAALLGVATALVALRRDLERTIRFVWGPEFLGVAALLHQRYGRDGDASSKPVAVINLDMVGEDPAQCGVPLVVERPPTWVRSWLGPLAEHVAEQVFAQTSSHAGTWRPGAFHGFSDHALFASFSDPAWRSPAVQLWHPGDPFNHSAADTIDKVSPVQMQRAIAIGAVLADVIASGGPSRDVLGAVVDEWCTRELATAHALADRHREVEGGSWSRGFLEHVGQRCAATRAFDDGAPARHDRAFVARWPGPFNYRGLLAALSTEQRDEVIALFLADKRNYAVLTHLAMFAPTSRTREDAIERTSFALGTPLDEVAARRLWSALFASAWVEEAEAP